MMDLTKPNVDAEAQAAEYMRPLLYDGRANSMLFFTNVRDVRERGMFWDGQRCDDIEHLGGNPWRVRRDTSGAA